MIDLHAHTTFSDGEYSPEELIDMAISKNISALAITDHDTVDGLESAVEFAKNKDILVVPGIEFDTTVDKGQMHILGLFLDYKNKNLNEKLDFVRREREIRNQKFVRIFNEMGLEITEEELRAITPGRVIGKPHFARVFINKGYIKSKDEMFDEYFNKLPELKIKKVTLDAKTVISLIKEASGLAILAHPQSLKLTNEELKEKIMELKRYGLDGMECYHSRQTKEQMHDFRKMADELGLLVSKGSDYHGPIVKPGIFLGTGIENNIVNDEEDEIINKLLLKSKNV